MKKVLKKKALHYSIFSPSRYIVLFFLYSISLIAQDNSILTKRLQRATFIYDFAEQIVWPDKGQNFSIGVLGNDRTLLDLKSLSSKRKINKMSVTVLNFNKIDDIENVQLLYVNKSFNYDIDFIVNKIKGRNILLITEDYNSNLSMINMLSVGNTFEYEINSKSITKSGLKYARALKSKAISSSSQKWKYLYLTTEKLLKYEKQKNDYQRVALKTKQEELLLKQQKIKNQEKRIDSFARQIKNQRISIEDLGNLNILQQKEVEEKVIIETELESSIQKQVKTINTQNQAILLSKKQIDSQKKHLSNLAKEIITKDNFLKEKTDEIDIYKKINWLLLTIGFLTLAIGLLIYRNYLSKTKLTKTLKEQNEAINTQSKIVEFKNKELEQFAYIASHDLKEPLATISGLIGILIDEYEEKLDENGKITLGFINESSVRMRNLIDALLEYSRLGKTKEDTIINVTNLMKSIEADLSNIIARKQATLEIKKLPIIKGTEFEIRLLFQNLINNAIKFTKVDSKPFIEIDCKKIVDLKNSNKGVYQFSIKDNGIGIHEKHKEKIFSIFQRLHSREEYEGTGIGLAHCKKIVESHGGTIWLESTVGEGSVFYFTIPYVNHN